MKWLLSALLAGVIGCTSSGAANPDMGPARTATLRLTVTAGTQITGIDHLAVTVEVGGVKSALQLLAGPVPPSQTFELKILMGGTANVSIEAQDAADKPLARGGGSVEVTLDQASDLTVSLQAV